MICLRHSLITTSNRTARQFCLVRRQFHYSSVVCASEPSAFKKAFNQYENFLKKYPKVYKLHRTVTDGTVGSWNELKIFWRINKEMKSGKPLQEFTREELEIYLQTPKDLIRITVIAIIAPLPMGFPLLFCAAIFFPRILLTRHFWTPEQSLQFRKIMLDNRKRFHYNTIAAEASRKLDTNTAKQVFQGKPLKFQDMLEINQAFEKSAPLSALSFSHKYHLCRAHGIIPLAFWRMDARLERKATVLRIMDDKLLNEDQIPSLNNKALLNCLFLRQLPTTDEEKDRFLLKQWTSFTTSSSASTSLILHAPVLRTLGSHGEKKQN